MNSKQMEIQQMIIKQIKLYQPKIITSLKQESIDVYLFLKLELEKTDIRKNHLFQFVFRQFYGMNRAGLTEIFYQKYFETLDEYKKKPESFNLEQIANLFLTFNSINRKNEEKKSLQFSFLTKLYHSIDPNKPIYDKYVCEATGIGQYFIKNESKKLEKLLREYSEIEKLYLNIAKDNLLSEIIEKFDEKFNNPQINLIMKYDFIFWQAGKLIEENKNEKNR